MHDQGVAMTKTRNCYRQNVCSTRYMTKILNTLAAVDSLSTGRKGWLWCLC